MTTCNCYLLKVRWNARHNTVPASKVESWFHSQREHGGNLPWNQPLALNHSDMELASPGASPWLKSINIYAVERSFSRARKYILTFLLLPSVSQFLCKQTQTKGKQYVVSRWYLMFDKHISFIGDNINSLSLVTWTKEKQYYLSSCICLQLFMRFVYRNKLACGILERKRQTKWIWMMLKEISHLTSATRRGRRVGVHISSAFFNNQNQNKYWQVTTLVIKIIQLKDLTINDYIWKDILAWPTDYGKQYITCCTTNKFLERPYQPDQYIWKLKISKKRLFREVSTSEMFIKYI